jgi:hypothetical protein
MRKRKKNRRRRRRVEEKEVEEKEEDERENKLNKLDGGQSTNWGEKVYGKEVDLRRLPLKNLCVIIW